jgi:hypothetical protein
MVESATVVRLVEILGLTVAAAYVYSLRRGGWREYLAVAMGGFLAEESSMLLYGYYGYSEDWLLSLHRTPVAVFLIWPLVILSSLSLVRAAAPELSRAKVALLTSLLVVYETLVIEPTATRAGLWWWKDGGYFGVPVLGVLGWGIFGAAAALVLPRRAPMRGWDLLWRPLLMAALTQAVLAPLAFPSIAWEIRIPLSTDAYAWIVGGLAALLCPVAYALRRRVVITYRDIAVKVAGAAIFFGLIYGLWLEPFVGFCSLVPLPYLVVARLRRAPALSTRSV